MQDPEYPQFTGFGTDSVHFGIQEAPADNDPPSVLTGQIGVTDTGAVPLRPRYCAFSEASTSMTSWILSPTTTPPVGSAMLAVMPQSVRLISPMADRPARVPP